MIRVKNRGKCGAATRQELTVVPRLCKCADVVALDEKTSPTDIDSDMRVAIRDGYSAKMEIVLPLPPRIDASASAVLDDSPL